VNEGLSVIIGKFTDKWGAARELSYLVVVGKEDVPPEPGNNPISPNYVGNSTSYGLNKGTLPCVGKPKVVVFVIDFKGETGTADNWSNYSVADVEKHFFDLSRINEPCVPAGGGWADYYSLRDYYYRASYGKLDITGTVIPYTTKKTRNEYQDITLLLDEVIETAGSESALDWSKYDTNGDGYIDGVYFALRNFPAFYSNFFISGTHKTIIRGGKQINQFAYGFGAGVDSCVGDFAHETAHLLGLRDIYSGTSVNPNGTRAMTIMENSRGELPGIVKTIFDWVEPQYIDKMGKTSVTLSPLSDKPSLAIVYPKADVNNRNWFVIEYITKTNNDFVSPVKAGGGIRIWRSTMNQSFLDNVYEYPTGMVYMFDYIESVALTGNDYFFYPGSSFTPNTNPNSNYPGRLVAEGRNKIMQDMRDSGIYLENIRFEGGVAKFDVTIK
jgi:M6 family metalloprotease-like protein